MPHARDEVMPYLAANHQADVVGCDNTADQAAANLFLRQTQGNIGGQQAGTQQHQQRGAV